MDNPYKLLNFPVVELVSFVDAHTAVLVGHRSELLKEGDSLYVLGESDTLVPKINLPLITPKVRLEVTFPAGPYVIAKTPLQTSITASYNEVIRQMVEGISKTESRPVLTKEEKLFLGDPGRRPVRIGDKAVRPKDLGEYIAHLAAQSHLRDVQSS